MYSLFIQIPIVDGDAMLGTKEKPACFPFSHTRIGREVDGFRMCDVAPIRNEVINEYLSKNPSIKVIGRFCTKTGLEVGVTRLTNDLGESTLTGTPEVKFNKVLYKKHMNDIVDEKGNVSRPTVVKFCHNWSGYPDRIIK